MSRKILTLESKDFLTGLSPAYNLVDKGLFTKMDGVSSVIGLGGIAGGANNTTVGILQGAPTSTDISGAVVTDTPRSSGVIVNSGTPYLIVAGDNKRVYRIDLTGDNAPTLVGTGSQNANGGGMVVWFPPNSGAGIEDGIHWATATGVENYDFSGVQTSFSGLTSQTLPHALHVFLENLYIGDDTGVAMHDGNSLTKPDLDLPDDYRISALTDDGRYLVIAATQNISGTNAEGHVRIYFWDTFSSSWQYETAIPGVARILAMERMGNSIRLITSGGVYITAFGIPPVKVLDFDSTESPSDTQSVDVWGSAIAWGGGINLHTFGKVSPTLDITHQTPIKTSGTISMINTSALGERVFYGTTDNKLHRVNTQTGGATGSVAETIYIELGQKHQITKIRIQLDADLASGDQMTLDLIDDTGTWVTFKETNAIAFAKQGAVNEVNLFGSHATSKLAIKFTFGAGAIKIKRIDVYGDKLDV